MATIWKGSISFGLVNIPIRLESATRDTTPSFRLLHGPDNSPIRTVRLCQQEDKPVEYKELVKGYEYEPGRFVIMEDTDFEQVALQVTRTIDIMDFVDEAEIDARYFDKPYYLAPQPGGQKAYVLLRHALKETGKVGVAKVVLRNREHLAALKVVGDVLVLDLLRFTAEIVPAQTVEAPAEEDVKMSEKETTMAVQLVEQLSAEFDPDKYRDEYAEKLLERIQAKIEGREVAEIELEAAPEAEVVNLVERLKESLDRAKERKKAAGSS